MGSMQSKSRHGQYLMPQPMFPPAYGPQPPPFMPYAYGQPPMYPPGVVPQTAQFGHNYMSQPPLDFVPPNTYRTSKRRKSDRYTGGGFMPQPGGSSRRRHSEQHARHNFPHPNQGVGRRAPTPFISPYGRDVDPDGDEDEDEDRPPPDHNHNHFASRRSYPTPPPVVPDLSHIIDPLGPASRAAFGPGPRPPPPLRNPLPAPPRDLYEVSPYKSVLTLPQTTALLTATYPRQEPLTAGSLTLDPSTKPKKSGIGGILRSFSRKDKQKGPAQKVVFVPLQVPSANQQPGSATLPTSSMTFNSMNVNPPSTTPTTPVPPIPSSPPAIRFDQTGKYATFMNHSPHRVVWNNITYPTALHLHEALKFMESRPDVTEQIRACERPEDVYPLSAAFQQFQRPDWGIVFLDLMKQVMYQKFRQHPDLRTMLLSTGTARLIYADADDPYWGTGPGGSGQNQLGRALAEVRDKLMNESIPVM